MSEKTDVTDNDIYLRLCSVVSTEDNPIEVLWVGKDYLDNVIFRVDGEATFDADKIKGALVYLAAEWFSAQEQVVANCGEMDEEEVASTCLHNPTAHKLGSPPNHCWDTDLPREEWCENCRACKVDGDNEV